MREGVGVFQRMQCRPRLGDGAVVSARYRKDEQALGQLTRRSARSPRSALEIVTTVINSAALPFLPYEDLQAEVLACDLTLRHAGLAVDRDRRAWRAGWAWSGGLRGWGRLLAGLLDRRVAGGGPGGPALGSSWGASGGFRRTRRRAKRAQQPRKPATHPVG